MKINLNVLPLGLAASALLFAASATQAGTVIYNTGVAGTATIALGVNDDGSLNTDPTITVNSSRTGLAYKWPDGEFRDATAPGCFCEGWGVSVNGSVSGYANVTTGSGGLTTGAPTGVSGSTVTTNTSLTALPGITVTQSYAPSTNATGALFAVNVTITNTTGAAVNDVKYVRVMDWDVPLSEFSEFVTIKGVGTTTQLERSGDNGFNSSNPLAAYSNTTPACDDSDCTDTGPYDHGAYFRFNFGTLADNASTSFTIYYGAAADETASIAAIAAEGIELYSLGQSMDGTTGRVKDDSPTYIFGFKGVGGTAVECGHPGQPDCPPTDDVPEPASLALMGVGLASLRFFRRRRQLHS